MLISNLLAYWISIFSFVGHILFSDSHTYYTQSCGFVYSMVISKLLTHWISVLLGWPCILLLWDCSSLGQPALSEALLDARHWLVLIFESLWGHSEKSYKLRKKMRNEFILISYDITTNNKLDISLSVSCTLHSHCRWPCYNPTHAVSLISWCIWCGA